MTLRQWAMLVLAAVGWGTGGVATRAAFGLGVGAWTQVALRTAIAAIVVGGLIVVMRIPRPHRDEWSIGTVMALTNLALPYVLFTLAYAHASAGFVAILAATIPLATALFANVMLDDEPLGAAKALGLGVGFGGAAVLALSGDSGLAEGGRPLLASLLALGGVASIGYAGVYAKRTAGRYRTMPVSVVQFAVAALGLVPAMLLMEGPPTALSMPAWVLVAYMAIGSAVVPFLLYYRLIQDVSASQVSLVGYLVPVVAVIGGIVFLGERLQPSMVIGGSLVLAGVVLADRADRGRIAVGR